MRAFAWALVAVAGLVTIAWWTRRRSKRQRLDHVRALRLACKDDQELVERLMFAELQRDEQLDYAQAARRALLRLGRDRR